MASYLLEGYFGISYIESSVPHRWGDQHLAALITSLVAGGGGDGLSKTTPEEAIAFATGPLQQSLVSLHEKAQALHKAMQAANHPGAAFLESSILLQIAVHRHGCEAVNSTAHGMKVANGTAVERASAHVLLQKALGHLNDLFAAMRAAEGTKWRGLYASDQLDDFFNVACVLRLKAAQVAGSLGVLESAPVRGGLGHTPPPPGPPLCHLSNGETWNPGTGKWSSWFEYGNTSANFPYLNPPPAQWSLENVVRVICTNTPSCRNTPVGGDFNHSAVLAMSTPNPANTIRYTLDGTEPGLSSAVYRGPVTISETAHVAARAYPNTAGSSASTPTTKPVFQRIRPAPQ